MFGWKSEARRHLEETVRVVDAHTREIERMRTEEWWATGRDAPSAAEIMRRFREAEDA